MELLENFDNFDITQWSGLYINIREGTESQIVPLIREIVKGFIPSYYVCTKSIKHGIDYNTYRLYVNIDVFETLSILIIEKLKSAGFKNGDMDTYFRVLVTPPLHL